MGVIFNTNNVNASLVMNSDVIIKQTDDNSIMTIYVMSDIYMHMNHSNSHSSTIWST
jgi:hypothetical protein